MVLIPNLPHHTGLHVLHHNLEQFPDPSEPFPLCSKRPPLIMQPALTARWVQEVELFPGIPAPPGCGFMLAVTAIWMSCAPDLDPSAIRPT
jgi:hypothetical protein